MPPDIALSDADFDDRLSRYGASRIIQGWDHGPVCTTGPTLLLVIPSLWTQPRPGEFPVRAWCAECMVWVGPNRGDDPNSLRLVEDDAVDHFHHVGARCSTCEACLPEGALRYSSHATVETLKAAPEWHGQVGGSFHE